LQDQPGKVKLQGRLVGHLLNTRLRHLAVQGEANNAWQLSAEGSGIARYSKALRTMCTVI
jgi:hypothetical protein